MLAESTSSVSLLHLVIATSSHYGDGYGLVRRETLPSQHQDTELQMVVVGAGRADLVAQWGAQE